MWSQTRSELGPKRALDSGGENRFFLIKGGNERVNGGYKSNVFVYLVNGDDDYLLIEFQKEFFLALIALILGRTNMEEHRMIQDIVLIQDDI